MYRVAAAYLVVAWILLQLASIVVDPLRLPAWTMPLLIVLLAVGFLLALMLAWAYDVTPEGLRRTEPLAASGAAGPRLAAGRAAGYAGLGMLIAIVGLGYYGYATEPAPPPVPAAADDPGQRLAVLPFANTSADPDNEYFSDGITDELMTTLSGVPGLRVISRTSAMRYRDHDRSIRQIAEELNVGHIVEGSVRRDRDRVRISVQLVDARTDSRLWAQTYERSVEDIFSIQQEIATTIVRSLRAALPGAALPPDATPAAPTADLEAYQLYLQGRHLIHTRFRTAGGYEGIVRSVDLLERATQRDPGFARAWAALASAYSLLPGDPTLSRADVARFEARAEAAIASALRLDPAIAEAYAVRGLLHSRHLRWADAERQYRRALEVEPQFATTHLWYGILLVNAGRNQAAQEILMRASELDPMNAITAHWLADAFRNGGRAEDARLHAQRSFDLGMLASGMGGFFYHLHRREWDAAIAYQERVARAEGIDPAYVRPLVAAVRDPARIPDYLRVAEAIAATQPAFEPLWYSFDLPDTELVLDGLEAFLATGRASHNAFWRVWEPQNTQLRNHPRFRGIAERVGLVDFWRENGWPDLCQPEGAGFSCR